MNFSRSVSLVIFCLEQFLLVLLAAGLLDVKKWPDRSIFIAISFRADMHYSWILR